MRCTTFGFDSRTRKHYIIVCSLRPKKKNLNIKETLEKEGKEKGGRKIHAMAVDLGINPVCTFYTPTENDRKDMFGTVFGDDVRDKVLRKENEIEKLHSRIARRDWEREKERLNKIDEDNNNNKKKNGEQKKKKKSKSKSKKKKSKKKKKKTRNNYRTTTRRLAHRLAKLRVKLHEHVKNEHYRAIRILFTKADVIIVNPLRVADIHRTSKKNNKLGRTARRNMSVLSPGLFVQRMIQYSRGQDYKKVCFGLGEIGTSKTCPICFTVNEVDLSTKSLKCTSSSKCLTTVYIINRDVGGAVNNFREGHQYAVKISLGDFDGDDDDDDGNGDFNDGDFNDGDDDEDELEAGKEFIAKTLSAHFDECFRKDELEAEKELINRTLSAHFDECFRKDELEAEKELINRTLSAHFNECFRRDELEAGRELLDETPSDAFDECFRRDELEAGRELLDETPSDAFDDSDLAMKEEREKKRKAEDDNINVVDRVKIAREERKKEKQHRRRSSSS